MLKYITSLYRVDEDMVLTDEEAAQRKEQLTIENEKLNQKVVRHARRETSLCIT